MHCTICGAAYPYARACDQAHEGLCHSCAVLNGLPGGVDRQPHPAPPAPPALTPRESQAVQAYQLLMLALLDPQALLRLLTEEAP